MTILAKIISGEEKYKQAFGKLMENSSMSIFDIRGETYHLFYPYQAEALERIGVKLEYYQTLNHTISRQLPILPKGIKLERLSAKPKLNELDKEKFKQFMSELEHILTTSKNKN